MGEEPLKEKRGRSQRSPSCGGGSHGKEDGKRKVRRIRKADGSEEVNVKYVASPCNDL